MAEGKSSTKVRGTLAKLSTALQSLKTLPEGTVLAFCIEIPSWYRLLVSFPKPRKLVLQSLIHVWGSGTEQIRLHAAVSLLKFCKKFPSLHEACARKMYLAFLKACKNINPHSIHILSIMTNSLAEVFALNVDRLSCLIFASIRKLAEVIRTAVKDVSKNNFKKVFSWPFCAAMKLWGLLFARTKSAKLADLLGPTVALCIELCCLQVTSFHTPFYLQMVRICLDLMEAHQMFIPVNHVLGHIMKAVCGKGVRTTDKIAGSAYCLSFMIKASVSDQANSSYVEALFDDCHLLLMRYIGLTSTWACFPEVGINCQNLLASALAVCVYKKFKGTLTISKNKLEHLIAAALASRSACQLPPNSYDTSHIQDNFAPVDFKAYVASLNSVQQLKEQQAERAPQVAQPVADKKRGKSTEKPSKKKVKRNIAVESEDKLVDFEL